MAVQKGTLEIPEGVLGYRIERKKDGSGPPWVMVTDYRGTHAGVKVPAKIEGLEVKALAKKTFLSRKNLKKVFLPETLEEIGDWAFAYCSNLESIWLPKKDLKLGNRIFMECPKVRRVYAYEPAGETEGESEEARKTSGLPGNASLWGNASLPGKEDPQAAEQTAALLAAAAVRLDAEYLLDIREAGTEAWIQKWDARMRNVMDEEDGDGYTKMILCGEEDYGCSLEEFIRNKRKEKVRLALLRLLHPLGLSEESGERWREYLLAHTKGCESEETWEVIRWEHGYEEAYFKLFADIGGINEGNFDALLMDMAGDYAEMKAFFISYKEKHMGGMDFFDALSLDDW